MTVKIKINFEITGLGRASIQLLDFVRLILVEAMELALSSSLVMKMKQ